MGTGTGSSEALAALFEETVALYHRLTADAAIIHGQGSISGPRRTVLLALAGSGPQTVARLARARAQSRQRFQLLVNRLVADGLVETRANPLHRQSRLVALTPKGERAVRGIVEREAALRGRLTPASSPQSLARAAAVLRDVRETLEVQLPAIVRASGRRAKSRRSRR